jgi:ligand-binding SRPBCC domain-containing protein
MVWVEDAVEIDQPVTEVFAALADPNVQIAYDGDMKAVQQLTPGEIGKGTRFKVKLKGMGWVESSYDEFDQDRLIQIGVRLPFGPLRHRFDLTPTGQGSRLTQRISVEPNLLGRVMWPLMMRRMMQKRVQTLNALVKKFVESRG